MNFTRGEIQRKSTHTFARGLWAVIRQHLGVEKECQSCDQLRLVLDLALWAHLLVQRPINTNPRLHSNPGLNFALQKGVYIVILC